MKATITSTPAGFVRSASAWPAMVALGVLALVTMGAASGSAPTYTLCTKICFPCDFNGEITLFNAVMNPIEHSPPNHHGHTECNMINCASGCDESEEEQLLWSPLSSETRFANLVAAGDGEALLSIAHAYPGRITFNAERNAIQVKGCGGALVAHLSINPLVNVGFYLGD